MLAYAQAVEDVMAINVSVLNTMRATCFNMCVRVCVCLCVCMRQRMSLRKDHERKKKPTILRSLLYCTPTLRYCGRYIGKHAQNSVVLVQCLNALFE